MGAGEAVLRILWDSTKIVFWVVSLLVTLVVDIVRAFRQH